MSSPFQIILTEEAIWLPAQITGTIQADFQTIEAQRDGELLLIVTGGPLPGEIDLGGWTRNRSPTVGDLWEARMDNTGGTSWNGSPTGVWHSLSANRSWTASGAPGVWTGILSIRRAGTTITLRSAPVTLENLMGA